MKKGVRIKYGDIAVGAKEQFLPSSTDKADFVDFEEFQDNISFPKYTNPCELYSTPLDGSCLPIPEDAYAVNLGWWSEQLSGDDGTFSSEILMVAKATDLFTSRGITLVFDVENNLFATEINVVWLRDGEVLSEKEFFPDSPSFFCKNPVEFYNEIQITFYSLNAPKNRLKLHAIEYGFGFEFDGAELKKVNVIEEIDPISAEIAMNTCDFVLASKRDIDFFFQERQPIEVFFDDELVLKTFVKTFKRTSKSQWSVETEDYIGIMENAVFVGGIYENEDATAILDSIFSSARVPFSLEGDFSGVTVSGYIPFTNCRNALMQVLFAIGAVVNTSGSDRAVVYYLPETVSQTVPLGRIMVGQSFDEETKVTTFELVGHKYTPTDDTLTLYKASESGEGEEILVKFSQPMHSLTVSGSGSIVESGANYAVVNAGSDFILSGKTYEHTAVVKSVKNPYLLATDPEHIVSVQGATLVSSQNIDELKQKCYDYFKQTRRVNSRIVERKTRSNLGVKYGEKTYGSFKYGGSTSVTVDQAVKVGDLVNIETEYLGNIMGRVLKQTFNLNGGILVKDTVIKEVRYDIR